MTGPLYRLGSFCVRHRFVVAPLWLVLAVALIAVSASVGRQTGDDVSLPGTDSQRAAYGPAMAPTTRPSVAGDR